MKTFVYLVEDIFNYAVGIIKAENEEEVLKILGEQYKGRYDKKDFCLKEIDLENIDHYEIIDTTLDYDPCDDCEHRDW